MAPPERRARPARGEPGGASRGCPAGRQDHESLAPTTGGLQNTAEASRFLGVSQRKLWSLYTGGDLPFVRIGKSIRFDPADLRDFVLRHRRGGGR